MLGLFNLDMKAIGCQPFDCCPNQPIRIEYCLFKKRIIWLIAVVTVRTLFDYLHPIV